MSYINGLKIIPFEYMGWVDDERRTRMYSTNRVVIILNDTVLFVCDFWWTQEDEILWYYFVLWDRLGQIQYNSEKTKKNNFS